MTSARKARRARTATWDDLANVPDDMIGQIIDGEVVLHPRPAVPHAHVASNLGGLLTPPFSFGRGGPGGWVILIEPRIRFGKKTILVPDYGGWRLPNSPGSPGTGPITTTPDWVCEVLSTSTEKNDRGRKLMISAAHGVSHVWLIQPLGKTLEVLRRDGKAWTYVALHEGEGVVKAEPFGAVGLELSLLWKNVGVVTTSRARPSC